MRRDPLERGTVTMNNERYWANERYLDVLERIAIELQRIADIQYATQPGHLRCPYNEFPTKACTLTAGHRGLHNVMHKEQRLG